MHSLEDLILFLESNKKTVTDITGWSFQSEGSDWTMAHDVYYKDDVPITWKEIGELFSAPKKRKKKK
jgi:hypothetical protein